MKKQMQLLTDTSGTVIHSFHNGLNKERIENKILSNSALATNSQSTKQVLKEMIMPSVKEEGVMEQYIVLETPYMTESGIRGTIFIYQSLDAIQSDNEKNDEYRFSISFHCFYLNDYFRIFLIDQNYFSTSKNAASSIGTI